MSIEEIKSKLIELYSTIKVRKTTEINSITPNILLEEKKNLEKLPLIDILNYISSTIDTLIELKAVEKYEEKIENDVKVKSFKNNTNNSKEDENGLILYEGMLIKAERDIRNHIRIEQELKIKIEDQEFEIDDLKRILKENENNNILYMTNTNRTFNTLDNINNINNSATNNITIINDTDKIPNKSIQNSIDIKKQSFVTTSNSRKIDALSSTTYPMFNSSNDFNINLINQLKKENARLRKMLIHFELRKNNFLKPPIQNLHKKIIFGSFNNKKLPKSTTKNTAKEKSTSKTKKINLYNKIALKVKCKDYFFTEKTKKDLFNTAEKYNVNKITPRRININKLTKKITPTNNKNNININNSIKLINNGVLIFKKLDDVKKVASKKQININLPNKPNSNSHSLCANSFIANRNTENNKHIKKSRLINEFKTVKYSFFNSADKDNASLLNNSNNRVTAKVLIKKKNGLSHRSTSNAVNSQRNEKQKSMYYLIKNNFINHKVNNSTFYENKFFNNYISIKNNSRKFRNNKEMMIFKKMQVPFVSCKKLELKGTKGKRGNSKMNINVTESGYLLANEISNRYYDSLNES